MKTRSWFICVCKSLAFAKRCLEIFFFTCPYFMMFTWQPVLVAGFPELLFYQLNLVTSCPCL